MRDRREAGQLLAEALIARDRNLVDNPATAVFGLARGGVPVAWEIAAALHAPLDACIIRKLGVPSSPELALGAVAFGGSPAINRQVVSEFRVTEQQLQRVVDAEVRELTRREQTYRAGRPPLGMEGRIAILVDDGLATGSSMRAAIEAARTHKPDRLIVAVGVAPQSAISEIAPLVDDLVCVSTPTDFRAVGQWYERFEQVADATVCSLLARSTT
ncbi:phosphoribosyltransferase [Williamsia sp.]|uniref:phosphoribosyltransferase n=1 Tax=Williamsia sp. TaxID=1872085 RepID=UPI002F93619B